MIQFDKHIVSNGLVQPPPSKTYNPTVLTTDRSPSCGTNISTYPPPKGTFEDNFTSFFRWGMLVS